MIKFLMTLIVLSISLNSFANIKNCELEASHRVQNTYSNLFVDRSGEQYRFIDKTNCDLKENSKLIECEVHSSDGVGALNVEYRVVLNQSCDSLVSLEIYYIE